ncbi:MAG TPA: peptide ABC transporter substrate-binding protein [Pyrinomonadaceae bacterium]|nr:peptide ABC transporter substrate-binding protein [Pyrinomonadaceae bacterium]
MKTKTVTSFRPRRLRQLRWTQVYALSLVFCLVLTGCFNEEPSTYYGKIVPPRAQEFRWSDGGLPQTFDPAFAAAPPDTDAVRALFEGLTDYDPQTLAPVPGVAQRWESSQDGRVWTFYLRDNARWSNGESVTAGDFVRSWQRTLKIGPLAPHTELLNNIEGATATPPPVNATEAAPHFGAKAIGEHVLQVTLQQADDSFPALVAHPVFRPVKLADAENTKPIESHELISNGAFLLSAAEEDRVRLERARTYWDGESVSLERVTFVNAANPEDALSAYHQGEIDAVTNAAFEPLALKLLAPYKDFRRSTFGALTYYVFNVDREPFDDVRVREALALAIDRERVSRDDLRGATEPAGRFLPDAMSGEKPVVEKTELLDHDVNKARELLAEAGYPDGDGFPVMRLLINRNEQQRTVAQSIAAMWRATLNIQTEIVIKSWDEYEAAIQAGDYDVVRRGLVMQTTSELTNIAMLFGRDSHPAPVQPPAGLANPPAPEPQPALIETEAQALKELKAMPIYFASSYSLVKPYVSGFDRNVLDAPSLKRTRLDTNWSEQGR